MNTSQRRTTAVQQPSTESRFEFLQRTCPEFTEDAMSELKSIYQTLKDEQGLCDPIDELWDIFIGRDWYYRYFDKKRRTQTHERIRTALYRLESFRYDLTTKNN